MLMVVMECDQGNRCLPRPCLLLNVVVCSLDCTVWLVFIVGQVAFNIKRL